MNILRTAALIAVFIKCVTASTDDMILFHKTVDEGNLTTAASLYQSIDDYLGMRTEMLNYVVDIKDQAFIFGFAKQANVRRGDLLAALHRKKSPTIIEEAFKVVDFSQLDLQFAASRLDLINSPDDFFSLLGKIERREGHECAVEMGISYLFIKNRAERFDLFLNTLEGNESFKYLKDAAIKGAFLSLPDYSDKSIVERYYDHPAVTSEVYAQGLIESARTSTQNLAFLFLLGEADERDLIAVQKHRNYKSSSNEFREVVEEALFMVDSSANRFISRDIQAAERIIEFFEDDSSMSMPTEVSQLIASYLHDESPPEPRTRFLELIVKTLVKDMSRRMPTVIPDLIVTYLSDEAILESIATSVKATQADDTPDESA